MHGRGRGGRGGFARGGRQVGGAMLRNKIVSSLQTNSTRRLQKDMKELLDADVPLVGVAAKPLDNNLFVWRANIKGPETSAFYGGVFHLEITFPQNYPCSPPTVMFMTDVPHPCVVNRQVKLDMLEPKKKDGGWYEGWSSAYTVESILIQLQSFLFEEPRWKRDGIIARQQYGENVSDAASMSGYAMQPAIPGRNHDDRTKYEKAVLAANEFRCEIIGHQGPGTPKPAFNEREADEASFIMVRDPKKMLADELLCYHSRNKCPEISLGIGVSLSRLPRTGEIRSVTPTLDLLSLRAFTK